MKRQGVLLMSVLYLAFLPKSQALDPAKLISQYHYRNWTQERGLPQNSAYSLIQTKKGYIWIATQEGIACFDGYHFASWRPQSTDGQVSQYINHLMEDKDARVWVATSSGLICLEDGSAVKNPLSDALKNVWVWQSYQDKSGVIWVATAQNGLYRFEDGEVLNLTSKDGLTTSTINCALDDGRGGIWIGLWGGLNRWTGAGIKKIESPILGKRSVYSLYTLKDGTLLMGTNKGLFLKRDREIEPFSTDEMLQNAIINAIKEDRDGNLWLGTQGAGLVRIKSDGQINRFNRETGLPAHHVLCFLEDTEGNLWFGMDGGGLGMLGDVSVTTYTRQEGLPHDLAQGLTAGKDGLWIATFGGGLARLDPDGSIEAISAKDGLPDTRLNAVLEDRDGRLWIATEGSGVLLKEDNGFKVFAREQGMPSNRARALFQDRLGAIWVATDHGLVRIYKGQIQVFTSEHGLKSRFVSNMFEDRNGAFWVATRAGLRILKDGRFSVPPIPELENTEVFGIFEDSGGRLWLSTSRSGLILVDGDAHRWFTTEDGLLADTVHETIEDQNGNLWMSSNNGISSIPIQAFLDRMAGDDKLLEPKAFGLNEGMKSEECNGGSFPSLAKTGDGRLWFPTMKGVVSVSPGQIVKNHVMPPVIIESFIANDRHMPMSDLITLPPETDKLEIHYTAASFTTPEKVKFKIQLQGYNTQWVDGASDRAAFYTNLQPGPYVFRVKAANSDGVWNETGAQVRFRIKAHMYESWWFRILMGVLAVLAALFLHRIRLMQVERRERRLEREVALRTMDLEKANARLLAAQGEVIAAAHRAGMIEVATNVLHLIGDSIAKISIISEQMDRKISSEQVYDDLKDEVELLEQHKSDLYSWFKEKVQGVSVNRRLVDKVLAMPQHATGMRRYVREIRTHLNHMTKTVRAQQEYARVHGSISSVDIPETIADALRLRNKLLTDLEIEIHQEFSRLPSFKGLKSKLLRVLVSLIQNACEAVASMPAGQRRITIRTQTRDGHILIEISDSGVGIPVDSFKKIFAHGYSGKPGHNGFGLHSCANSVAEMGGRIMVDSDGLNSGATFILELPIASHDPEWFP